MSQTKYSDRENNSVGVFLPLIAPVIITMSLIGLVVMADDRPTGAYIALPETVIEPAGVSSAERQIACVGGDLTACDVTSDWAPTQSAAKQ